MKTNKYILTLALTVCCALGNLYAATITSSYYSTIDGKSGKDLFDAIHTVSKKGYSSLSYAGLWTAYQTTDVYPTGHANAGKIWDMYGNCVFTYSTNQCGSYSKECDCYNREHSIPKSWFGGTEASNTPGSDLFHVVPTDGKVNGTRSNYAFGEVTSATYSYAGSKLGTKKSITISNSILNASGSSTQTCSTSPVFEPVDEYKGDFARGYLGTMIRWANGDYQTFTTNQGASIFNTAYDAAHYYGLTAYGVALLLKWHRQDPVSQKEIDRNNGIQAKQGNRNPFIDYPCLVEYIWGNKAGETVTLSSLVGTFDGSWTTGDGCPCGDVPAITLPSGDIFVGSTEAGTPVSKTITVQGVNLEANLSLAISGTNSALFSLSATSIQKTYAEAGTTVTITYTPTAAGNHSAVLTISGGGLSSNRTFNLTGTCCNPYTVTFSRNGITEQVGACGTFALPTAEDEEDACDGWEFQGWVTSSTPFSEGQTSAPTFVTEVSSATTLYAVYGKGSGSGGSSASASVTFLTTGTTSDDGTDNSQNIASNLVDQASGISTYSGSKLYKGKAGMKMGASGSAGSITLNLSSAVTTKTVTIVATKYGSDTGTLSVTANGSTAIGSDQTPQTSESTLTFTTDAAVAISSLTVATSTKRAYVKSITIGGGSSSTTTYKKSPCTTYTISYADAGGVATGGTYSANVATALAGTTISLDYDEAEGYEFAGWTVTNASTSATIAVTNDQFTMPEANVTVQANFNALCSKLSAPDVTATPGDEQITLTWEDVTGADHYTVSIGTGVGYTTECSSPTVGTITNANGTNTCVITGLVNGLEYTTSVVANGISSICDSDPDEDTTTPSAEIPTEVTVTFNANGGEGTMSDQTIPYNTATALDANTFTRTGYTFQGWATEQSGAKEYNDGASVTLIEDITLYAVWQINSHNVTFTQPTSGGTFTVNSSSSSPVSNVNYGSTVTIAITPTNSHFTVNSVTVSGASGDVAVSGDGNTRTFTMPDEDVTVTVTMTEDPKYTVNWYVSGTATPETNYAGEALEGVADPSIECNDKVFQGWTSHNDYDSDDAPDDLFTSVADMTMPVGGANYYAVFATVETTTTGSGSEGWIETAITALTSTDVFVIVGNNYAIPNNATSASPAVQSVTIADDEITSEVVETFKWNISGNATDGYTFYPNGDSEKWLTCTTTAASGSNNNIRVGTGDRKVWSVDENGYLVTKDTYTARYLSIYTNTNQVDVDFRGYINTNSAFEALFYKYTEGSSTTTTTISGYTTSCAAPENVTVTFNANDGSDVPATATQTIPYNTATALTANSFSRTGYHFTGWNTATDGSSAAYADEAEVTLTKDMTLYAQWTKNSYNVSFTPTMTGATITVNGQSTSPQSVAFESEVTIAVTTDVAYAVDEVSVVDGEDEPVSVTNNGDGTYTFTMPASAVTVTVTLTANPLYTIRFIDNGAVISTQEVFEGQSAVKPSDPTPCEGYAFAGWWDAPLTTPTTTAETWITDFTASADQDYYAVYSETSGGGASTPVTRTMSTFTAVSGNVDSDENISYAAAQGASATAPAVNTGEIRIYQNGGTLTVTANNSKKITAVTIGSSMATSVTYAIDGGSASTSQSIAASGTLPLSGLNASSILFTCTGTSRTTRLYLNYLSVTYSDGGSGSTTYYTTAPDCEPEVTPTDMMIVAEYGGARIALTHNNEYTSFGATPMMFVGGKYYYPDSESAAEPVIANMTWQVAEVDGEGYTIKAGEQYLAPIDGAIALSDEKYMWPMNEDGAISYDAKEQTFVVGGEGSLLPKIHVVPVPAAEAILTTWRHSDRTLTPKRFGTLCLPHAVALPFAWGVRVYSVSGAMRDDSGNLKGIYLEEEIEMLEAGKPYLIEPVDEKNTSTMQMWYAEGMDYVTDPVDAIAMVGNLSTEPLTVPRGYYVLSQNQLRKVAIDNQTIGQYKAYFDLDDLEDPAASPQAHAYKVMYVADSEQVVTDLSQTPGGINWDEPVYNILGMRVDRNATGVLIQGGVKFIIRVP